MKYSFHSVIILVSIALILIGCDEEKYLVLPIDTPTITYAGKVYHTVTIGNQTWLRENLNVGIMIDGLLEQKNNGVIEKYCYNNDLNNCETYGGLYQWAEAVQNGVTNSTSPSLTGNVQGICPNGWHIPSEAEFQTLSITVNNNSNALKAIGQGINGYDSENETYFTGAGTNTSRFSALLVGRRDFNRYLSDLGYITNFWSSTESDSTDAYFMSLYYDNSSIQWGSVDDNAGFSVRCLKD